MLREPTVAERVTLRKAIDHVIAMVTSGDVVGPWGSAAFENLENINYIAEFKYERDMDRSWTTFTCSTERG